MPGRWTVGTGAGLVAALGLASPAMADETSALADRHGAALAACHAATPAGEACRGLLARPCMETEPGGFTTIGMVECIFAETRVWDGWLNDEYRAGMDWAEAADAAERETFPEFANRATALRDAQRAWIAFRDAECGLEYAVWGAGSMRQIAGASCHLEMTAARTADLVALRDSGQ